METGQTYEIIEEHHPLGQEKTIVQVVKTPLYGADGSIIGLQGIFWDITAQKRAEEQIRRATAELSRSREELRTKNPLMEENLRMAREIQLAMLPQQYPIFPAQRPAGTKRLSIRPPLQPAESVSGDFFSISALSDTEVGVFICDVTGHGVRAALVTAMIRALAEELKPLARDPGMFLRKLNSDLCSILKTTGSPMLTTAFYRRGRLADRRACALPTPAIPSRCWCAAPTGQVEPLANASGRGQPALGLFDDPPYQTTETTLAPGDFLMLFTDGLYEVQGQNEELYSQERLMMDVKNLSATARRANCSTNCWKPSALFPWTTNSTTTSASSAWNIDAKNPLGKGLNANSSTPPRISSRAISRNVCAGSRRGSFLRRRRFFGVASTIFVHVNVFQRAFERELERRR